METTTTLQLLSYTFTTMLSVLLVMALQLYNVYWVRPGRVLEKLRRQGIRGPGRQFPTGNTLDMRRMSKSERALGGGGGGSVTQNYSTTLFPYFDRWREDYGPVFAYSMGNLPSLYVSDPDLVREIGRCVSLDLGKATHLQKLQEPLFGHGIIKSNGVAWARQRKLISPEFFMDKVKGMVELIVEAAVPLLKSWESRIERGGGRADFMVDQDLRSFSADVISRACFGSSFSKGKDIFRTLTALQAALSNPAILFNIPNLLRLKDSRKVRKLAEEVRLLILNLVKERRSQVDSAAGVHKDLLQSILEGSEGVGEGGGRSEADGFIVDNCKNIYFAGQDTASVTLTWCLMLLASHPHWQSRARDEVLQLCRGCCSPDARMLHKMRTVTMVVRETLRLFPPSSFVSRESLEDMRLGGLRVPKGTTIWIPIATMHHDKDIWGEDADEFRPERFAKGVSGACKSPHAYIPFGLGARKCVGQNLAMVETKIALCLILCRFRFSLSPNYTHSPAFRLTVAPEFGLHLHLHKL